MLFYGTQCSVCIKAPLHTDSLSGWQS